MCIKDLEIEMFVNDFAVFRYWCPKQDMPVFLWTEAQFLL